MTPLTQLFPFKSQNVRNKLTHEFQFSKSSLIERKKGGRPVIVLPNKHNTVVGAKGERENFVYHTGCLTWFNRLNGAVK